VIKAILRLDKVDVKIVLLTSDGASTNRTMWSTLGINPKIENFNNSFLNPFGSDRKVYVFSDAPHLLKTVRNRLYNKNI